MAAFREISYAVADGVCTLTLDRPERLNAVTSVMIDELIYPWWTDRPFTP